MAEPTDVVDRADSLMRRRRSFVASAANRPPAASEIASQTADAAIGAAPNPPTGDDDDLPVLTDVVVAEAAVFAEPGDRFDETQVSVLASDIAHAIGQQLTSDLPNLIETALANAGEELRAGINATLESALRDFIARRKQLRLPLDEPERRD